MTTREQVEQHSSASEEQTIEIARSFAGRLLAGDAVLLFGNLGAGKTRFVRGLAMGLGHPPELVASPTFVFVHEYDSLGARLPLIHLDAYRLTPDDDPSTFGLDHAPGTPPVLAIEWPERIPDWLPDHRYEVTIEHAGVDNRTITIDRVDA